MDNESEYSGEMLIEDAEKAKRWMKLVNMRGSFEELLFDAVNCDCRGIKCGDCPLGIKVCHVLVNWEDVCIG